MVRWPWKEKFQKKQSIRHYLEESEGKEILYLGLCPNKYNLHQTSVTLTRYASTKMISSHTLAVHGL